MARNKRSVPRMGKGGKYNFFSPLGKAVGDFQRAFDPVGEPKGPPKGAGARSIPKMGKKSTPKMGYLKATPRTSIPKMGPVGALVGGTVGKNLGKWLGKKIGKLFNKENEGEEWGGTIGGGLGSAGGLMAPTI